MTASNGYWLSFDGTKLHWYFWEARKPKAAIYLIHGMGEHAGRYEHVARFFNDNGISCLSFDLRGHGRSLGKRGHAPNFEALMKDIDLLVYEGQLLARDLPSFSYGHSLGGNLVLNYALRRKTDFRGVIATSPWLELVNPPKTSQVVLANVLRLIAPSFTIKTGLDSRGLARNSSVSADYDNDRSVHGQISLMLFSEISKAARFAMNNAKYFPLPLLLVHGSDDPITSPSASQRFAKQAPNAIFKSWEGLFHETHNESIWQDVLTYNLKWLNNLLTNS